jgi:ATP synthase protein I
MLDKSFFRQLLDASTVGLNLVISTFVGLAMGYGIDKYIMPKLGFQTFPWFMIIFLFVGIFAGFRELLRMAKKSDGSGKKGS